MLLSAPQMTVLSAPSMPFPAGWRPDWEAPLLAVAVVVPVVLAGLLAALLINVETHMELLRGLLPGKASEGGGKSGDSGARTRVLAGDAAAHRVLVRCAGSAAEHKARPVNSDLSLCVLSITPT
jgi:hypothetical protein